MSGTAPPTGHGAPKGTPVWSVAPVLFRSLEELVERSAPSAWSDRYYIWRDQPLDRVLRRDDPSHGPDPGLPRAARFDFTFTTRAGRPSLSVEYDGLRPGESLGTEEEGTPVPHDAEQRSELRRLKLLAAERAGYPLVILDEPDGIAAGTEVGEELVDGLAVRLLARRAAIAAEPSLGEETQGVPYSDDLEAMRDALLGAEEDGEVADDPVARAAARLREDLAVRGVSSTYRIDERTPHEDPSDPYRARWSPGHIEASDRSWAGMEWWSSTREGSPVVTRLAVRAVHVHPAVVEGLVWEGLELLHPLHLKYELLRRGALPPRPWSG